MTSKINRQTILAVIACVVAAMVVVAALSWQRLCGNWPVKVYGRIVDEKGNGISAAAVEYRILFSDQIAIRTMYGKVEKSKEVTVTTDIDGNYCLDDVYGYSVRLLGVKQDGKVLHWAMGPPYPDIKWRLSNPVERSRMPRNPEQRITYVYRESE